MPPIRDATRKLGQPGQGPGQTGGSCPKSEATGGVTCDAVDDQLVQYDQSRHEIGKSYQSTGTACDEVLQHLMLCLTARYALYVGFRERRTDDEVSPGVDDHTVACSLVHDPKLATACNHVLHAQRTLRFKSTSRMLAMCMLRYYRIQSLPRRATTSCMPPVHYEMRKYYLSTGKTLAKALQNLIVHRITALQLPSRHHRARLDI